MGNDPVRSAPVWVRLGAKLFGHNTVRAITNPGEAVRAFTEILQGRAGWFAHGRNATPSDPRLAIAEWTGRAPQEVVPSDGLTPEQYAIRSYWEIYRELSTRPAGTVAIVGAYRNPGTAHWFNLYLDAEGNVRYADLLNRVEGRWQPSTDGLVRVEALVWSPDRTGWSTIGQPALTADSLGYDPAFDPRPMGDRFEPGVFDPHNKFSPEERATAERLAAEGWRIDARPENQAAYKEKNPDAMVRKGPEHTGVVTDFKTLRNASVNAVKTNIRTAIEQAGPGGQVVVDGRDVGLTEDVAREGFRRARIQRGSSLLIITRIILGDGSVLYLAKHEAPPTGTQDGFGEVWENLNDWATSEAERWGTSPHQELQQFAVQRVLWRIFDSQPDAWMLKGGQGLLSRFLDGRPSSDIDLVRMSGGDLATMTADYETALARDHGDDLVFVPDPTATLELNQGTGIRLGHIVLLGGRELIRISADLNSPRTRPLWRDPDTVPFPGHAQLIRLTGPRPPDVRVLSLHDVLAHKVSGIYTYGYRTLETRCPDCLIKGPGLFVCRGADTELPYRQQDLADVLLLALRTSWDGPSTHAMLREEFAWRIRQGESLRVPERFEIPNSDWFRTFTTLLNSTPGLAHADIGEAVPLLRAFLDPLLGRQAPHGLWDPVSKRWIDGSETRRPHEPVVPMATSVRPIEWTGQAPPSTAVATRDSVERWDALLAPYDDPRSVDARVAALKARTDLTLDGKLQLIHEMLRQLGYPPTRVPGLDTKNLRFYAYQSGELYGHAAALILDPETTVEIAYRPGHNLELYMEEAYDAYLAHLGAIPDGMDAAQANAVAYWRAFRGLPMGGVDPGDLIDIQVQPLRDALALRQLLIDGYGIEPHRIRLVFAGTNQYYNETRWERAQLLALNRLRESPVQARQAIVAALEGPDGVREQRIRGILDRLYQTGERYALLWVRSSLGEPRGFVYGATRDTRPEILRQTIETVRRSDPDRRIVLLGDDIFAGRPELRDAWTRDGVLDGVDSRTLVRFWEETRLSQAEQALLFHRLNSERDVVQIGVYSGALETAALLGMPTVYFEPVQHVGNRGWRLQLYWDAWVYGSREMVRDEDGNPVFDDLGRPVRRFRQAGDPLPAPLTTIRRVIVGAGRSADPRFAGTAGADYGTVALTSDRIDRLVRSGEIARWSQRLGRSLLRGEREWQVWSETDWLRSKYYVDQLARLLSSRATTAEAAARKWLAMRLALTGVLDPGFTSDRLDDDVTAVHPYTMLHTDQAMRPELAGRIESAFAAPDRAAAMARVLEEILGDPSIRVNALDELQLFRLSPDETTALRDAIDRVLRADDELGEPSIHPAAGMQVIVIAKEPIAGRVKTRLTPPFTHAQGAELAGAALADTLAAVGAVPFARRILALDGTPGAWLPDGVEVIPQRGTGLDERLVHAFDDAFAGLGRPIILIGMDTPQVTPDLLTMAAAALRRTDAVFGPATDGGFWILGLRKPDPALILGIPMSRDDTGAAQLDRLRAAGLTVTLLPALTDVDTATEAATVAELAPTGRFAETLHRRVGPAPDPLEQARRSGGFSWSPASGTAPATGFMVALEGHAVRYPAEILDDPSRFAAAFRQYLIDNRELFENRPDMYLGGWLADGQLWFEPARNVIDRDEAIRLARDTQQQAIYDVAAGEYIRMGDDDGTR